MDKLYNVYKTVLEMLNDRKLKDVPELPDRSVFVKLYDDDNLDIVIEPDVYVFILKNVQKYGKQEILSKIHKIQDDHGEDIRIIMCLHELPNTAIKQELKQKQYYNVEIFTQKNLQFNITKHVGCPKHIILTDEEKKNFLAKNKIKESNLSQLPSSDPIAKYYGIQQGSKTVVKILRKSEATGITEAYRFVP